MKKRFTDADIWEDDWFLELPEKYKLMWQYVRDRCDHAGFWRPAFKKLSISIADIDLGEFFNLINQDKERIRLLDNGKWLIIDFVHFQYGKTLHLNNRAHKSVYDLLCDNEVKLGSIRGQIEVKKGRIDKDKDKDKDLDKVKDMVKANDKEQDKEELPF